MSTDPDCIFCKIIRNEIPSRKVYEDDDVLAFHDIHPAAPVHVLVIPKKHIAKLSDATAEDQAVLGKMMLVAAKVAEDLGSTDGFRTIVNVGRVGRQDVFHLHMHVLGGPDPLGRMIQPD
ncbi:MAG: histidine triad nucleotide-binding protein [Burkholderiales bacterium]|nr:MAG: histidine triad nucleotide-binding protein [Betaproteobacteria bacterium]TAG67942.1 MAG: histidine triad nucleotide-binding protein [Burkholderiales bacterium]